MNQQEYAEKIGAILCICSERSPRWRRVVIALEELQRDFHLDREVFAHASAYEKLLEQTREKCPNMFCAGGVICVEGKEAECPSCHGTGYIEHPERICVLAEDQKLPLPSREIIGEAREGYYLGQMDMASEGFKKVLPGNNEGEK